MTNDYFSCRDCLHSVKFEEHNWILYHLKVKQQCRLQPCYNISQLMFYQNPIHGYIYDIHFIFFYESIHSSIHSSINRLSETTFSLPFPFPWIITTANISPTTHSMNACISRVVTSHHITFIHSFIHLSVCSDQSLAPFFDQSS